MISSSQLIRQSFKPSTLQRLARDKKPRRAIPPGVHLLGLVFNWIARFRPQWVSERLTALWFRVMKPRARPWVHAFWASADASGELHLYDQIIPVYFWGRGPLVVCLHGWGGSGTQFRAMIPQLVAQGYRVAAFDAPSHGYNPGNTTNVLEIAQCLMALQQQYGHVDTIVAHSFGGMATLTAAWQGFKPGRMALIAPGLDVSELFDSFCNALELKQAVRDDFHQHVGDAMAKAMLEPEVWRLFSPECLLQYASEKGFLIYDEQDEEVSSNAFIRYRRSWRGVTSVCTQGLGHYRILKDESAIAALIDWLGPVE